MFLFIVIDFLFQYIGLHKMYNINFKQDQKSKIRLRETHRNPMRALTMQVTVLGSQSKAKGKVLELLLSHLWDLSPARHANMKL